MSSEAEPQSALISSEAGPRSALVSSEVSRRYGNELQQIFGRQFNSFAEITEHLGTMEAQESYAHVTQLRDLMLKTWENDLYGFEEIADFVQGFQGFSELRRQQAFQEAWDRVFRLSADAKKRRNRRQESKRRLSGLVGEGFVEEVVIKLIGGGRNPLIAVTKALKNYPLRNVRDVLRNACKHMVARLQKRTKYGSGELYPTTEDISAGNETREDEPRVTQADVDPLGRGLQVDEEGIVWRENPGIEARRAWDNEDFGRITTIATPSVTPQKGKQRSEKGTPKTEAGQPEPAESSTPAASKSATKKSGIKKGSQEESQESATTISTLELPADLTPLKPGKRARPPTVDLTEEGEEVLTERSSKSSSQQSQAASAVSAPIGPGAPVGTGFTPINPPKRTRASSDQSLGRGKEARIGLTDYDIGLEKTKEMFRSLKLTEQSAKEAGRRSGRLAKENILKKPVPLDHSTDLDKAMWMMITSRVSAFREGRTEVMFERGAQQLILKARPQDIEKSMDRLVDALARLQEAQTPGDESSLAAYAQGAFDQTKLLLQLTRQQDRLAETLSTQVNELLQQFTGTNQAVVATRNRTHQGNTFKLLQRVSRRDAESFLLDRHHDGWLSAEAIMGVMAIDLWFASTYIVDSYAWAIYVRHDQEVRLTPYMEDPMWIQYLVIPWHFPLHWALLVVSAETHHAVFFDSMPTQARGQQAYRVFQKFRSQHASMGTEEDWTFEWMSNRQNNTYDCGIYVIENARNWIIDGRLAPVVEGNSIRGEIVDRLTQAVKRHRLITGTCNEMLMDEGGGVIKNTNSLVWLNVLGGHKTPPAVPAPGSLPDPTEFLQSPTRSPRTTEVSQGSEEQPPLLSRSFKQRLHSTPLDRITTTAKEALAMTSVQGTTDFPIIFGSRQGSAGPSGSRRSSLDQSSTHGSPREQSAAVSQRVSPRPASITAADMPSPLRRASQPLPGPEEQTGVQPSARRSHSSALSSAHPSRVPSPTTPRRQGRGTTPVVGSVQGSQRQSPALEPIAEAAPLDLSGGPAQGTRRKGRR